MTHHDPVLRRALGLLAALAVFFVIGAPVSYAQTGTAGADAPEQSEDPHLARRGFYQRRAAGKGWFITHTDPAMARSRRVSDVLRLAPGVNVIERGSGVLAVSGRSAGQCPLAIFADGAYTTIRNVDELSLGDLAALEVYRGPAEVPAGFHAPMYDRTCGALLVWSRVEVDG